MIKPLFVNATVIIDQNILLSSRKSVEQCESNWLKLNDGILVTNLSFKKKLTTRTFVLLFKTNNKEKK